MYICGNLDKVMLIKDTELSTSCAYPLYLTFPVLPHLPNDLAVIPVPSPSTSSKAERSRRVEFWAQFRPRAP